MGSLQSFITESLEELQRTGLYRSPRVIDEVRGPHIVVDGRKLLCFCSNDYLGFSQRREIAEAAAEAAREFGWGGTSARLLSGTTSLHARLEERIARFKKTEAALFFPSGYMANIGLLPVVADAGSVILADKLNHASLIDAAQLSRARVKYYPHADVDAVIGLLREHADAKKKLIVTDAVFSMDGDLAPLRELQGLASFHGAELIIDDAHGNGVLGLHGRGTLEHFGMEGTVALQTATLSKAAGSAGGFIAGSSDAIRFLRSRARSFLFTTSPPPAVCAAGIAALELLENSDAARAKLRENILHLRSGLRAMGHDLRNSESPILPVVLGSNDAATAAAAKLWDAGFFLPAIRPPTVPRGTSRLRISVTALHEKEHLDALLDALRTI